MTMPLIGHGVVGVIGPQLYPVPGDHQADERRAGSSSPVSGFRALRFVPLHGFARRCRTACNRREACRPIWDRSGRTKMPRLRVRPAERGPLVHAQAVIDRHVAARLPRVLNEPSPGVLAAVVGHAAHGLGVVGDVPEYTCWRGRSRCSADRWSRSRSRTVRRRCWSAPARSVHTRESRRL